LQNKLLEAEFKLIAYLFGSVFKNFKSNLAVDKALPFIFLSDFPNEANNLTGPKTAFCHLTLPIVGLVRSDLPAKKRKILGKFRQSKQCQVFCKRVLIFSGSPPY
jgi:hypothetical protein